MEISEQIRKVLPQMPGRSGDELLMGITEILYLHYEVVKPLIPQVKENGKLAGKILAMVEDMVSRVQCGCSCSEILIFIAFFVIHAHDYSPFLA